MKDAELQAELSTLKSRSKLMREALQDIRDKSQQRITALECANYAADRSYEALSNLQKVRGEFNH